MVANTVQIVGRGWKKKMICDKCIDKEICDGRCFHYKERIEVKDGVVIVVNGGQKQYPSGMKQDRGGKCGKL